MTGLCQLQVLLDNAGNNPDCYPALLIDLCHGKADIIFFSGHPPPVLPDVAVEDVLWFVQFMFPGSSGTGTEMPAAGRP